METVDQYAQDLRSLFNKAYPSVQQGTKEAETFRQTVLVNQFVAGLRPEIKSKLVGLEGNFSQLLAKARFEEAKLHHFDRIQSQAKVYLPSTPRSVVSPENDVSFRPQRSGVRFKTVPKCYNCGSSSHLIRQCPYSTRQKYTEATGNKLTNESTIKDNNVVSNVTPSGNVVDNKIKDTNNDLPLDSGDAEVNISGGSGARHYIRPLHWECPIGPCLKSNGNSRRGACRGLVRYWFPSNNYTTGGPFGYFGKAASSRSDTITVESNG